MIALKTAGMYYDKYSKFLRAITAWGLIAWYKSRSYRRDASYNRHGASEGTMPFALHSYIIFLHGIY